MSIVRNVWLHDGEGNPLGSHIEPDGTHYSLNMHNAHVHTEIVNRHFIDYDSATENFETTVSAGSTLIPLASTTGFSEDDMIVLKDHTGGVHEHHFQIVTLVPDTSIKLDRPIDRSYTTSGTIELVDMNMSVVGTIDSPGIYEIGPPVDEVWHINRVMISITSATVMDDSKFGSIDALTNGVTLRENLSTGYHTITNWKSNSDMIEDMYDVTYSDKAPAGYYGLRGRFTFSKADVIIRLVGAQNDTLQILIQDTLTGLQSFRIKAQGHREA